MADATPEELEDLLTRMGEIQDRLTRVDSIHWRLKLKKRHGDLAWMPLDLIVMLLH